MCKNDIVFITKLNHLGQVSKLAETQLKIIFSRFAGKTPPGLVPQEGLDLGGRRYYSNQAGMARGLESQDG